MKQDVFYDLYTPEGEQITQTPWQSYPRPQMRREGWLNLNGMWEFTVCDRPELPEVYDKQILVPFAPETLLSGLKLTDLEGKWLFYRTHFTLPEQAEHKRILLHFGAVDQFATVWVNGVCVGTHAGGYEHFTYDITDCLAENNELIVRAVDHMSNNALPYGKQCAKRGGMWYTPTTGIWQTVWLEWVPEQYIQALHITQENGVVKFQVDGAPLEGQIAITAGDEVMTVPLRDGFAVAVIEQPRRWSPEDPFLYTVTVETREDRIESYFAIRDLTVAEVNGIPRLCLNGKPYFFHGILDQGYWSDGLLTPADAACYDHDILTMKSLGFNMLRKHIKIEPEEFYYACDRLGMVVFQDLVNNGQYRYVRDTVLPTVGFKRRNDKKLHRDPVIRQNFLLSMEQTVARLREHPCICYWTIFNEGWGQFDGTAVYHRLKQLDDTRFIDTASGWYFGCESDVVSEHIYFRPFKAYTAPKPLVLSEFGGYCYPVEGHLYHPSKSYGYRSYDDPNAYAEGLVELYERDVVAAIPNGLCASVYTQVSDVEDEINGLVTFDRKVVKVDAQAMLVLAAKLKIPTEEPV